MRNSRSAPDITNQIFGRLTVLEKVESNPKYPKYNCQCSCGNTRVVRKDHLRSGSTTSCGCVVIEARTTHGKAHTREYSIWEGMVGRCKYPSHPSYSNYGGRGIKCEFKNFEEFYACVGDIPEGMEVDRIDGDGNYAPGNLRFATRSQQNANKSKTRKKTTSQYKGVYKHPVTGKYEAAIFHGKKIHLGRFVEEWDAAEAYNKKALELFGQYASLNVRVN